ncbi:MAG: hypothetical protein WAV15_01485 [Minisyncoccia bacterium]
MDMHHKEEDETKKIYLLLIRTAIIFAIIGFYLAWLDNGPGFLP